MNKLKEEFDSVIGETAVTEVNKEVEFWKSVEDCFIGMSSAYDNAPLNIYKLIREFINKNYISREQILNLECLKEEVINKELERQAVTLEKMNDYRISADEILEDIGKSYNQRNELRNEIKKEIEKL